jgi:hypothetical protein
MAGRGGNPAGAARVTAVSVAAALEQRVQVLREATQDAPAEEEAGGSTTQRRQREAERKKRRINLECIGGLAGLTHGLLTADVDGNANLSAFFFGVIKTVVFEKGVHKSQGTVGLRLCVRRSHSSSRHRQPATCPLSILSPRARV